MELPPVARSPRQECSDTMREQFLAATRCLLQRLKSTFISAQALPAAALEAFFQRWDIAELWLFGSVLRDDFSASSDIDILISYFPAKPRACWL